jgi:hypothetical protein
LHRTRLDRELAGGCGWDASEDLALRARQLVDPVRCRQFARSLRRALAAADDPLLVLRSASVPASREALTGWREALLGLAERLERPGPINPCGVARTRALLTDGLGPLYNRDAERSIAEAVWWIADGLQLCPPHAWGCPVIMKLDPEHVAWTCGRCGAITTTGDPAVRPA